MSYSSVRARRQRRRPLGDNEQPAAGPSAFRALALFAVVGLALHWYGSETAVEASR